MNTGFKSLYYLIACFAGFTCAACQPTVKNHVNDANSSSLEIEGFVPVRQVIENWDEQRKNSFQSYLKIQDGEHIGVSYAEPFRCQNAENRIYDVKEINSNYLKPFIVEAKPLEIPVALSDLLNEVLEADENERFQYHFNYTPVDILRQNDGWLVAYDQGEWGGMLLHVKDDGSYRVLDENNTSNILTHDGVLYTAHGVDHLFINPEYILVWRKTGKFFRKYFIPTPSAVYKLAAQDNKIAGLLRRNIIYIDENGVAHFKTGGSEAAFSFQPKNIGFLKTGDVYVAGNNMIGIYRDLPNIREVDLFIPKDCDVIFKHKLPAQ